jgi:hypothetical protein
MPTQKADLGILGYGRIRALSAGIRDKSENMTRGSLCLSAAHNEYGRSLSLYPVTHAPVYLS